MHVYKWKFVWAEPELGMIALCLPLRSWHREGRIRYILSRVWKNLHHAPSKRRKMLAIDSSFGSRNRYSISLQPTNNIDRPGVQQAPWSIVDKTPSRKMNTTNFPQTGPSCTYLYSTHTKYRNAPSLDDLPHISRQDSSRFLWSTPFLCRRRCWSSICSCGKRMGTIPAYER
jgi:hypothetical protein